MNPQEAAIFEAINGGALEMATPFLGNAEIVQQAQIGAAVLGGPVGFKGRFESTTLKNWLLRGYFRPYKRLSGVRNYLYSGSDLMALLTMAYLVEFGIPVEVASYVAAEIREKLILNPKWDGDLDSVAHRIVALSRIPVGEERSDIPGANDYLVTLPDFAVESKPDVVEWLGRRHLAGALFIDWKFIAKVAIELTQRVWRAKAEQLVRERK